MGVIGGVGGESKRLAVEVWGSWWGRGLFFLHLVVAVGMVGYAWNNLGDPWTLEVFVPAWRAWVFMVDWPAQPFMRWYVDHVYARGGASRMGDAVMMFCVSVPWWFYGYGAEKLAAWVVRLAGDPVATAPGTD